MEHAVWTDRLTKVFGAQRAVDAIDLRVPAGSAYGFLGANGAGKTTTVEMLTCLSRPTSGSAKVFGFDVARDAMEVKRRIGVVSDADRPPLAHWDAVEYVSFFGELHGMGRREAREGAERALRQQGLGAHLAKPVGSFSSGMRKKVELARAVLHRPALLFLDEPTRQLDIVARADFWRTLRELHGAGSTIFLTSHDPAEVAAVCTHIGVMDRGRLLFQGTMDEFCRNDRSAEGVRLAMERFVKPRTEFSLVSA